MASYRSDSAYRNTSIVEGKYLDIYESTVTNLQEYNLVEKEISPKYHQRPDLMAHDLYGNSKLWWVFLEFNQDDLEDPILDFVSGLTILVPTRFS